VLINLRLISKNDAILKEIRRCNYDLGVALDFARQGNFWEAKAAARRWADRMQAHCAGRSYTEPQRERGSDEWRSRFAP
jgi:hypothetical protein